MFTSFNENDFEEAINKKDYLWLKACVARSMLNDPTFERGETKEILDVLKEKVPEIFEEEIKLDFEERLERSAWDKRYFTGLVYCFQENFAESRIAYIQEVGKVVHKDTAESYRKSIRNPPPFPNSHAKNSRDTRNPTPKALISIATNLENFTKPMRKAYSDIKILNSSLDKDNKIRTDVIQELHSYCINTIRIYNQLSKICISSAKKKQLKQ